MEGVKEIVILVTLKSQIIRKTLGGLEKLSRGENHPVRHRSLDNTTFKISHILISA